MKKEQNYSSGIKMSEKLVSEQNGFVAHLLQVRSRHRGAVQEDNNFYGS